MNKNKNKRGTEGGACLDAQLALEVKPVATEQSDGVRQKDLDSLLVRLHSSFYDLLSVHPHYKLYLTRLKSYFIVHSVLFERNKHANTSQSQISSSRIVNDILHILNYIFIVHSVLFERNQHANVSR